MPPDSNASRPNIIVVLADDMGYSDIGCYGGDIRTSNLNAIARQGTRFTQMYNCARCCPTRASLLTGLYPHQAGVGFMVNDLGLPGYRGFLREDSCTIAESLRPAGYRTYLSGKWHVGGSYNAAKPHAWQPGTPGYPIPTQRGFDRFWGIVAGATNYFNPHTLMEDDRPVQPEPGSYFTDAITDHACGYVDEAAGMGKPFFLHVAYTAPHWPLQALPEDIARYEGKYHQGWDATRASRHEELKGLGLLDPRWGLSPRDADAPAWFDLDPGRRRWEDMRMAVYAAMVDRMDQGIGRLLERLDWHGIADNTIFMFLSDNGGCAELLKEDGHAQQYDYPTLEGEPVVVGNIPGLRPGAATTFMSYDLPWANASNAPFRLYKHWVHEGGVSTPFLVRWPARFSGGAISHQPCHVVDIAATCLEAAKVSPRREKNGQAVPEPDGESFLPAMEGKLQARARPIFFEHEGNRAVRDGRWKLVSRFPGPWELYNMEKDRTELHDVAPQEPETVRRLSAAYDDWANSHQVVDFHEIQRRQP